MVIELDHDFSLGVGRPPPLCDGWRPARHEHVFDPGAARLRKIVDQKGLVLLHRRRDAPGAVAVQRELVHCVRCGSRTLAGRLRCARARALEYGQRTPL